MKFGGTSVANLNRIKKVAQIIRKKLINKNQKALVVLSAMSGVTNNLVKEFSKLKIDINNPEYDSILSTGEQYSSSLMSLVLSKSGLKSRSLLGWQIPIETDSNYSRARIKKLIQRKY